MLKQTGISVAMAFGALFQVTVSVGEEYNQPQLVIVFESPSWLRAIEQLANDECEIHCWNSERPEWFSCGASNGSQILILTDPNDQRMSKEIWRERLQNQGCAVYPIKLQRASSVAGAADLLRSLHHSLVAFCPEKQSTWDANLEQALVRLRNLHAVAHVSSRDVLTEK